MLNLSKWAVFSPALCLALVMPPSGFAQGNEGYRPWRNGNIKHVLLLSIDGMHAVDYLNCSKGISGVNAGEPYCPVMAALGVNGVTYNQVSTSRPSDSFPGLMALASGGNPQTVGAWYDVAYDRVLAPPAKKTGNGVQPGTCTPNVPSGTTTEYEEGIDLDQSKLNGGTPGAELTDGTIAAIDPLKLVRDPANNCAPVYPWNFVRTNTIFGVIHQAGGYAAWSDKHPSYSSVAGPGDGSNLDDYYSPEINSLVVGLPGITTADGMSCAAVADPTQTGSWTDSFQNIKCYDQLKVNAILNWIEGKDHRGQSLKKIRPNIYGMNFQSVSVGQKLIEKNVATGGYTDAYGRPTASLLGEIKFVDASVGMMVNELKRTGLFDSTLIVITAKHGQSPIDPNRYFPIPGPTKTNGTSPADIIASLLPDSESPTGSGIGPTQDDVSLLWLADPSQTSNAVSMLEESTNAKAAGIGMLFVGPTLQTMFDVPGVPPNGDPRTPDIIVAPNVGVTYTGSSSKLAEHGGFSHDDTNVMLLISNPTIKAQVISAAVETAQVAPTILQALKLDPNSLESVQIEGTSVLPGLVFHKSDLY